MEQTIQFGFNTIQSNRFVGERKKVYLNDDQIAKIEERKKEQKIEKLEYQFDKYEFIVKEINEEFNTKGPKGLNKLMKSWKDKKQFEDFDKVYIDLIEKFGEIKGSIKFMFKINNEFLRFDDGAINKTRNRIKVQRKEKKLPSTKELQTKEVVSSIVNSFVTRDKRRRIF
jgi:hypothetical protein